MTLFGQRAGPAMLALVSQGSTSLAGMTEEMRNSGGTAQLIADTQLNTFQGKVTLLKSGLEGMALSIGSIVVPVLQQLVEKITPVIQKVTDWMAANPRLTQVIVIVAGAIGGLLVVLGGALLALSVIIPVVGAVGAVLGLLASGPVLLVIAAIVGLVALFVLFRDEIMALVMPVLLVLKDFFMEFVDFVLPHLVDFWQNTLMPLWSEFVLTMETTVFPILYKLRDIFLAVFGALKPFIMRIMKTIFLLIKRYMQTIIAFVRIIMAVFRGDWEHAWNLVKGIFTGIFDTFSDVVKIWWGTFRDLWDTIWGGIEFIVKGAVNKVLGFINRMIEAWNGLSFTFPGFEKTVFGKTSRHTELYDKCAEHSEYPPACRRRDCDKPDPGDARGRRRRGGYSPRRHGKVGRPYPLCNGRGERTGRGGLCRSGYGGSSNPCQAGHLGELRVI